ncbi:hypothetical protein CRYUN_Cryun18bG0009100 [Craigia yunnanensis]
MTNLQPEDNEDSEPAVLEGRRNPGMHGSCMHSSARPAGNYDERQSTEIALSSSEESFSTAVEMYGCSERETEEVLGPCEWLDNEIKRLSSILQYEGVDPSGNNASLTTNGENGVRDDCWGMASVILHHQGIQGLFDQEWVDWEKSCGGFQYCDDDQWELWDDSDKVLCWLLDWNKPN